MLRAEKTTAPTSPPGNTSGFSLLELIIVLVLLGVAALVVAPSFTSGLGGIELETTTRDLITRMRQARSAAVSQQRVHRIVFPERGGPEEEFRYILTDDFEQPLKTYTLPEEISFEYEDGLPFIISFYPNGRSSGGRVVLAHRAGRKTMVRVSPITGFGKMIKPSERSDL